MTKKICRISSPILCITSFFAQQFLGNNFVSLASSSNRNLRRPLARFGAAARGASMFHGHQLISVKKSDDGDDADASLSHRRSLSLSLSVRREIRTREGRWIISPSFTKKKEFKASLKACATCSFWSGSSSVERDRAFHNALCHDTVTFYSF